MPAADRTSELRPLPDLNTLSLPELYTHLGQTGLIRRLLEIARDEDLGPQPRDLTAELVFPDRPRAEARIVARRDGVLAGLACMGALIKVFAAVDPEIGSGVAFSPRVQDGQRVEAGGVVGSLTGNAAAIVRLERTMLNLIGRLSGIATLTARFVAEARAGGRDDVQVLDTRKTTPGLRVLEKYAVRCGGGACHRLGLFDAVLIKDNHLAGIALRELPDRLYDIALAARGTPVAGAGGEPSLPRFVEVEVDTLEQLAQVLKVEPGLIDIVLLDNMGVDELREAVRLRDERRSAVRLEASGGVSLETVRAIAGAGVDRISAGALTHSATGLDFGLDF